MKNIITTVAILATITTTIFALVVNNRANNYKAEAAAYKQAATFYSQKSDKYQKLCDKVFLSTVEEVSNEEILNYVDSLSALNSESCPVAVILNSNK